MVTKLALTGYISMTTQTPINSTPFDLVTKYKDNEQVQNGIKEALATGKYDTENTALGLKAGDVVTFLSGYDGNILMKGTIWGFSQLEYMKGFALITWDCYWHPIDLPARNFSKEEPV